MIVYPATGYNSFISTDDAENYFEGRLYSEEFITSPAQEAALITAFHAINALDVTIDATDTAQLQALKNAQCEQALHELRTDLDAQVKTLGLPDLKIQQPERPRYSERAMDFLRPYMTVRTIEVLR
ncbi:hypothetical protein DSCW_12890 [Desulfosarcina widdelii]|uniref:Uncharacterized protein n=1 Tax=Desulfosarcina widdelii TaxID=947919 RepID=A0A5K7YVU9_9BACT|nr:hypothetical protein [Desulfosarcina widdelii]BBO73872.1 hypothetical protein DSCW_12890 [Desulfosarcina widdelii]